MSRLCGIVLALSTAVCVVAASEPVTPPGSAGRRPLDEGKELLAVGKYAEACKLLKLAVATAPEDMDANWCLGRAAYESGDCDTAVAAYERMLTANPELHRVRLEIARTQMKRGRFDEARKHFRTVLAASPPPEVRDNIQEVLDEIARLEKTADRPPEGTDPAAKTSADETEGGDVVHQGADGTTPIPRIAPDGGEVPATAGDPSGAAPCEEPEGVQRRRAIAWPYLVAAGALILAFIGRMFWSLLKHGSGKERR